MPITIALIPTTPKSDGVSILANTIIEKIDNSFGVFSYEKVGPIIAGKIE